MELNEFGEIAYNEWLKLPERFQHIVLGPFQIMPDHIHGIIILNDLTFDQLSRNPLEGQSLAVAPDENPCPSAEISQKLDPDQKNVDDQIVSLDQTTNVNDDFFSQGQPQGIAPPTLFTIGQIVGAFKSIVVVECLARVDGENEFLGKFWQRNYFERIIHTEKSYQKISKYIKENVEKWGFENNNNNT